MHAETSSADRFAARHPIHLISLGTFFYAIGPVIARSATTTGVLLSFWRLWFGLGLLGICLAWHARYRDGFGNTRGQRLAVLAGAMFSIDQMLFFSGIQRVSVIDASLVSTHGNCSHGGQLLCGHHRRRSERLVRPICGGPLGSPCFPERLATQP